MDDLNIDKITSMWQAHNDGVYKLDVRENIGEIVGYLLKRDMDITANIIKLEEQIRKEYPVNYRSLARWQITDSIIKIIKGIQ